MKTKHRENEVYDAVTMGLLEIDQDGTIWRLAELRGNRWNHRFTLRKVPRRRAEKDSGQYLRVAITLNQVRIICLAQRLVWRHFKGPIPADLTINHINGKKKDNRPENLELATHSEQMKHAYRIGLKHEWGQVNPAAKLTDGQVEAIRAIYASGSKTQAEIAVEFGVRHQQISKIARGDRRPKQSGPVADYVSRRDHANKTRDEATGQFRSA
jgi:hypothetical protein